MRTDSEKPGYLDALMGRHEPLLVFTARFGTTLAAFFIGVIFHV